MKNKLDIATGYLDAELLFQKRKRFRYVNYHVMTLFPEMINQALDTSIMGRAREKGLVHLNTINIRDFRKTNITVWMITHTVVVLAWLWLRDRYIVPMST